MYYCLSRCFLFDPFQCCFAVFSAPLYFFPRDRWHPKGEFPFFSKTKKRGLKVVVVQSSPIIPSVKVASRTFLLLFCVWLWLRQQFVWCPSKLLSLWETKQWCESLCYYDGISLQIATENLVRHKILFLFYEPYHFLESHLESLLGTEFCWVSI